MTSRVHLVGLQEAAVRALYARHDDWAATEPLVRSTPWPEEDRRMLGYRVAALDQNPLAAPYLLHLILDPDGSMLGRIGCHAAPDRHGQVEIGYFVDPDARGRGVAGQALDQFLIWLGGRGVRRVKATVGPRNVPSLALLRRRGFDEVGTQWDEEDGLELVFRHVPHRPGEGRYRAGMSAEEVVRTLVARIWNEGRLDELDQYFATTFDHAGRPADVAELRAWHEADAQVWADTRYEIVSLVSDGRQVAVRWRASARQIGRWGPVTPTGITVTWDGVHFFTVEVERVTSMWAMADMFAKATQLGVVMTAPEPADGRSTTPETRGRGS